METGPVEGPWELPDGWAWRPLGGLATYVSRGRGPKYVTEDGQLVVNQKCVRWWGLDLQHAKLTSREAAAKLDQAQFLQPWDILWNSTGTGTIGRAALVDEGALRQPLVVDSHVTIVRPDRDEALPRWLHYWIQTNWVQSKVEGIGSTNQVELSKGQVLNTEVPVPPLDAQWRIVARIDELFSKLDDGEAALARARADLETYRKSLLKAAVTGELTADWRAANPPAETGEQLLQRIVADRKARWEADPKNKGKPYKEPVSIADRDLTELPLGWCWASLDQLVSEQERSFQSGPFGSSLLHSEFQATGNLVIGIDNVQAGWFSPGSQHRISKEKYRELVRYKARPEDVLITVMATIGRSCVVPPDIEDAIITKHIYRTTIDRHAALPSFVECCFRGCPLTLRNIHGNVQGQTRPGLNKGILQRVAIPVPPMREQEAILQLLRTEGLSGFSSNQVKAATLTSEQLRQSILAAAFRGELVQ